MTAIGTGAVLAPHVLDTEEMHRLAAQVMAADAPEPFGAYLFHTRHPGAALARSLETAVMWETFGDTPEALRQEYRDYEDSSFFFCVIDHRRRLPAGMMRVIVPSSHGFKSLNDIEPVWGESAESVIARTGLGIDPGRTWDIATLAVDREYRGKAARGLVTMGLYQSLIMAAFRCGVVWFVAIFDMPVLRLVRWKLRLTWAGFDGLEPARYLGSTASIPAWCDLLEAERKVAAEDPDLHAILRFGEGLEPALRRVDLSDVGELDLGRSEQAAG